MTTIDARNERRKPRICMPTRRRICKQVFHCSLYEAEDVLVEIDDVDLICLEPDAGFQWRNRWLNRLAFRDVSERLVLANPGLRRVRLTRDYDLFVAVCQSYEDLPYVNAIEGWKDHCKTSVCWIDEVWAASIHKYRHWMNALRKFDHVIVGLSGSVAPLSQAIGRPCHWVPPAVDTVRFSPHPIPAARAARVIDVLSMGRKSERIHQALRPMAARNEIFYLHDTFAAAGAEVFDHRQQRDLLASLSQRSRYFLVAVAKMDVSSETQGQIDVGNRYYEGAAAGAVMIGQAPDCASFREMFDWQDAVIEIQLDGSDVADILRSLDSEPQRLLDISQRNVVEALLRHDWLHRWQYIFQVAGLQPSAGMIARRERLQEIADRALTALS
jgi:Glycosyl transferases group 1